MFPEGSYAITRTRRSVLMKVLAAAALVLLLPAAVFAQRQQQQTNIDFKWLSLFEQSYGSEGLYVVEIRPTDPAGQTRLDLQSVNSAALQFRLKNPGKGVSLEALEQAGLLKGLPPERTATFQWNPELELFVSDLGPDHSPTMGVVKLLEGNRQIRRRLLRPDAFTRDRWRKLFEDPETPEAIKREILLREFVLDHTNFPEALLYERTQEQLKAINDAVQLYAMAHRLEAGAEITFRDLRESGMFAPLGFVPDNVEFILGPVGERAKATINGVAIVEGPQGPALVRRNRAEALLKQRPTHPPAMALAARYREPAEAVRLLTQAINQWPTVAGLRVERMAAEARRGNFTAWTTDMDFLLLRFPAAPLLIEVDVAAENGRVSQSAAAHAAIIVLLADQRPDLLTHQIMAIQMLGELGRVEEAQTIYDRLVFANPAWRTAIERPGS